MKLIALPVLFLLAASPVAVAQQGATPPPAAPAATADPAKPAEEPKMVCRNEHVTGSRVQKQRVCRPANDSGNDQSSALQRELDKIGNVPAPPGTGIGN
jgi:hypothetical protein